MRILLPVLACGFATLLHPVAGETVTANFTSADTIPVTSEGYTANGKTVRLSLSFAPNTGSALTVVKNTALGFISGQFSNLAQGEKVALCHNGVTYRFVANYYGGSGNDFVLVWASQRAYSSGWNYFGTLGDGTEQSSQVPVTVNTSGVLSEKTIIAVAAGGDFSLALCSDGKITAWGGQYGCGVLGDGTWSRSNLPVAVDTSGVLSGKTVVSVAAGSQHCLALCSDNTVIAWGNNTFGQLGDGTRAASNVPVAVSTSGALLGKTVVSVAAGWCHSLAICSDGTAFTWGLNNAGQLGDGTSTDSSLPVAVITAGVLSGRSILALAGGYFHTLAVCSDGQMAAWGSNTYGKLGNNSTMDSTVPVAVSSSGFLSGKTVVSAYGGNYFSLALCSDGTVATWGGNIEGQLGIGTLGGSRMLPGAVSTTGVLSGKTVVSARVGQGHSLVRCSNNTVAAWGDNGVGQFGNNERNIYCGEPVAACNTGALSGKTVVVFDGGVSHSVFVAASPLSEDSSLSALSLSAGTLSPAFTPGTTSYTVVVPATTPSIAITPTLSDPGANVSVNGSLVQSGSTSVAIPLSPDSNTIQVVVTAENGTTTTYTVVVPIAAAEVFLAWISGYPGLTDTTALGDPDSDSVSNLLEYVLAGHPGVQSSSVLPNLTRDGNSLIYTFVRRAASVSVTQQIFRHSPDLVGWTDVLITGTLGPGVVIGPCDGDGNQAVTVTIPAAGQKTVFGMLKVTLP